MPYIVDVYLYILSGLKEGHYDYTSNQWELSMS
jgi:hypothetical protein